MSRRILPAALALAVAGAGAGAFTSGRAADVLILRVGVAVERPSLHVASDGPVLAEDTDTGVAVALAGRTWIILPALGGLDVGGSIFGPRARLSPQVGVLRVEGRGYRGVIEIRRTPEGRLTAINEIDLEAYLYGVIKAEIDPQWPPEAVKAQAVAARTLALERVNASRAHPAVTGFDLPATTDAQLYLGVAAEDPAAVAAVDATRSLVVTYQGHPIFAAYHSNSGGHTEDSEHVWGTIYPYLRGVPDPYALGAPGAWWSARLPLAAVAAQLRRGGVGVPALLGVLPASMTPWGRAITVRLLGEDGRTREISANRFRLLVGPEVLRSTMFTIVHRGADIEFSGRGAGHGVGLDQWGARSMAAGGFTYEQILKYYYTGVAIEQRF
ncbi:MAG TPA: SpoIID/LytB domain-containing protein [bacterium]|nr:SpoIID/LytB domain-containing protein [bacterium]